MPFLQAMKISTARCCKPHPVHSCSEAGQPEIIWNHWGQIWGSPSGYTQGSLWGFGFEKHLIREDQVFSSVSHPACSTISWARSVCISRAATPKLALSTKLKSTANSAGLALSKSEVPDNPRSNAQVGQKVLLCMGLDPPEGWLTQNLRLPRLVKE